MTPLFYRRSALRAGMALGASLMLPPARACEYFAANLRILHPWTRASTEGDHTAVVSMTFDEVTTADRLIAVETSVAAGAEMGGPGAAPAVDFFIPEGQVSVLSESGTHVRLLGLRHPLEVGRSYPMRLMFERSGSVGATLNVDYTRLRFK